ncbi:MAG TPA: hypothetical protein PLK85_01675 [Alphaproteobacteria bacterium]|nr:hypothetical protein [Alphaproteobacteria bacterium]
MAQKPREYGQAPSDEGYQHFFDRMGEKLRLDVRKDNVNDVEIKNKIMGYFDKAIVREGESVVPLHRNPALKVVISLKETLAAELKF